MSANEEQRQLDSFIDKFSPDVATRTREEIARMRALLPCAIEMVYDNYNALAIGFGPSERAYYREPAANERCVIQKHLQVDLKLVRIHAYHRHHKSH